MFKYLFLLIVSQTNWTKITKLLNALTNNNNSKQTNCFECSMFRQFFLLKLSCSYCKFKLDWYFHNSFKILKFATMTTKKNIWMFCCKTANTYHTKYKYALVRKHPFFLLTFNSKEYLISNSFIVVKISLLTLNPGVPLSLNLSISFPCQIADITQKVSEANHNNF